MFYRFSAIPTKNKSDGKRQEPYDFPHVGRETQSNKQMNKQNKLLDADNSMRLPEWKGVCGRMKRLKAVKYTVTEGDQTLGGEYTVPYRDDVL